jgi:hypothetical protein
VGKLDGDHRERASSWRMRLSDPDCYGEIVQFATEQEAKEFELYAKGKTTGMGIQIRYIQYILLDFLLRSAQQILGQGNTNPVMTAVHSTPDPPSWLYENEKATDLYQLATQKPYRLPRESDFALLRKLVSADFKAAQDYV